MAFLYRHVPTQLMMAAHPQTLYGLADSPVALAAWMIDHDVASYGHIAKLFVDGEPYGDLTRDDILDNITLSWLTNTGVSSARLYVEYKGAFFNDFNISVPAAVSVFPEEVYQAPRSWTERAYPNLIHFNAARQRRTLCRLGTAATVFRRSSRGLQVPAQIVHAEGARGRDGVARTPCLSLLEAETYVRATTTRSPPFLWDSRAVTGRCVDWHERLGDAYDQGETVPTLQR